MPMNLYVSIRSIFVDHTDQEPALTADTVFEADDSPQKTGLLDVNGTPIFRVKERATMGFVANAPVARRETQHPDKWLDL
jgi:hypothetical protein